MTATAETAAARVSSAGLLSDAVRAHVRSNRTGLRFVKPLTFDDWRDLGEHISGVASASAWWLGDWLLYGRFQYGQRYKMAIASTGLDYQTLRNYASVAKRYPPERRRDALSFQHHAELCALADDEQDRWLDRAAAGGWSRNALRMNVRAATRDSDASELRAVLALSFTPSQLVCLEDAAQDHGLELCAWAASVLLREVGVASEVVALPSRSRYSKQNQPPVAACTA